MTELILGHSEKRRSTEDLSTFSHPNPEKIQKTSEDSTVQHWNLWRKEEQATLEAIHSQDVKTTQDYIITDSTDSDDSLDKLKEVQILKEEGNLLFKDKQYTSAARKYYEALDRISHCHGDSDRSNSFGQIQDALCVSIAQALYFSGKYEEVIQHCRRYCKDNAKVKFWHALSLYETQQYEKSIAVMKEAIKLEPNNNMLLEKLKEIKLKYQEKLSEESTIIQLEQKESSKGKIIKWALVGLALAGIGLGIYYIKKRKGA